MIFKYVVGWSLWQKYLKIFAFKKWYKLQNYYVTYVFVHFRRFSVFSVAVSFCLMLLNYTFLDLAEQVRFINLFEYSVAETNPKIFDMKHDNKMQKYKSATRPPQLWRGPQVKIYHKLTLIFTQYFSHVVTTFWNYYILKLWKKFFCSTLL